LIDQPQAHLSQLDNPNHVHCHGEGSAKNHGPETDRRNRNAWVNSTAMLAKSIGSVGSSQFMRNSVSDRLAI